MAGQLKAVRSKTGTTSRGPEMAMYKGEGNLTQGENSHGNIGDCQAYLQ